jgi:hypothetical protein
MEAGVGIGAAVALLFGAWVVTPDPSAASENDGRVGEVTAVLGSATAARPGEAPRPLACGDPVFAGERVTTSEAGGVGLLVGHVYVQLAADSTLRLDRGPEGAPDLGLEAGGVGVVDPHQGGAVARLGALDARATLEGNDLVAHLFAEKAARFAIFCEYGAPLEVARGDERVSAQPGDCVIAKPDEPLYAARAHEERVPLAALDACKAPRVALGPAAERFAPTDVAAPPISVADFPEPGEPSSANRDACEQPGLGCTRSVSLGLVTSPPGPGLPPGIGLGTSPTQPGLPPGAGGLGLNTSPPGGALPPGVGAP